MFHLSLELCGHESPKNRLDVVGLILVGFNTRLDGASGWKGCPCDTLVIMRVKKFVPLSIHFACAINAHHSNINNFAYILYLHIELKRNENSTEKPCVCIFHKHANLEYQVLDCDFVSIHTELNLRKSKHHKEAHQPLFLEY